MTQLLTRKRMKELLDAGVQASSISILNWTLILNKIVEEDEYDPEIVKPTSTCALCEWYGDVKCVGSLSCHNCPLDIINNGCLKTDSIWLKIQNSTNKNEVIPLIAKLLILLNEALIYEDTNNC